MKLDCTAYKGLILHGVMQIREGQAGRQTGRQTDRQTDRQTAKCQISRQVEVQQYEMHEENDDVGIESNSVGVTGQTPSSILSKASRPPLLCCTKLCYTMSCLPAWNSTSSSM